MGIHNCNYCQLFPAISTLYIGYHGSERCIAMFAFGSERWHQRFGEMHSSCFFDNLVSAHFTGFGRRNIYEICPNSLLQYLNYTHTTPMIQTVCKSFVPYWFGEMHGSDRWPVGSEGWAFWFGWMIFLCRAIAFRLYSVAVTGCKKTTTNYLEESCNSSHNMEMLLYSVTKSPRVYNVCLANILGRFIYVHGCPLLWNLYPISADWHWVVGVVPERRYELLVLGFESWLISHS